MHELVEQFTDKVLFKIKPELVTNDNIELINQSVREVFNDAAQYVIDVVLMDHIEEVNNENENEKLDLLMKMKK